MKTDLSFGTLSRPALFVLSMIVALTVIILTAFVPLAVAQSSPQAANPDAPIVERACPVAQRGKFACGALRVKPGTAAQVSTSDVARGLAVPSGFGPADLQDAYKLDVTKGAGNTIAIVDAQDDPNAESDMATYRAQFGLPPCTTANGCFRKINQDGAASPLPAPDRGWASEIALDLEMVSAVCPDCSIVLVEANSANDIDLGRAVNTAAAQAGVVAISNSYGSSEDSTNTSWCSSYFMHPGIAVTASNGDSGYGAEAPASCQYVTAVGGTSLVKADSDRGWTETVWNSGGGEATGSGCSAFELKPAWQTDPGCSRRTVGDVAAVADPRTGVAVYDTYGGTGWEVFGGTSVGAPLIAGVYGLATPAGASDFPSSYLYANPSALFDVTEGNNGTCGSNPYLCTAEVGYDGPTGLGTPNGSAAFGPITANDFSISANPGSLNLVQGSSGASTISTTITSGSGQTLSLNVTGVPAGSTATLNPPSINSGDSSTLTVNSGTASAGTYTLTITATGASATHEVQVALTVTQAPVNDFSISANPTSLSLVQNASGASTISTAITSGNSQTVNLTVSGVPAGATATLNPSSINAGSSSTLTVNAGTAAPGAYTLTITGTGTSATHSVSVTLIVTQAVADFSITASPSTLTVGRPAIGVFKVAISALNGFSGQVKLTVGGFPSKVAGAFVPQSITGLGTSYLIFVVGLKQQKGTFPLTITGTSGSISHSIQVTLSVN